MHRPMGDEPQSPLSLRPRGVRELGCVLLLVAFFVLWHSAGVFGGGVYASEDTAAYFFSNRATHHALATSGDWSFWDPLPALGQPRLANIQNGSFSPITILFYALPTATAFSVYPAVVLCLIATFAFALFRARGLGPLPALFGALSWASLGSLMNHVQHPPVVETLLWLPATLFGWEMAIRRRSGAWAVAGGLALAFQCFGGSPQYLVYNGLLMALWIGQGLFTVRHNAQALRLRLRFAIGIAGVGIGLASWQLLPFLEMLEHSHRSLLDDPARFADRFRAVPREVLLALAAEWLWWNEAPPLVHGAPYLNLPNLSLLVPLLTAAAFWRSPRPWAFGIAALLLLLGMLGSSGGVSLVLAEIIPFADRLRAPYRMLVPAAFLLAFLAALGLDRLRESTGRAWRPLAVFSILWVALIGWTLKRPLDLYVPAEAYHVPAAIAEAPGRIVMDFGHSTPDMPVFLVNAGLAAGVPTLLMREVLIPRNFFEAYFASQFGPLDQREPLDRVIESAALPLVAPGAPILRAFGLRTLIRHRGGDLRTYTAPAALDRFHLVPAGVVARDPRSLWELVGSSDWDPARRAILREPLPGLPETAADDAAAEIRVLVDEKDRQRLAVKSTGGLLVTSELFFPGWEVEVDGQPAEPVEADLALRAVQLEAGRHTVEWNYHPTWLMWAGVATTFATIAALLTIYPPSAGRSEPESKEEST